MRASLEGDTEAWGEIVTRYKEAIFGLCLGFLRNRADAEDLTHDTFIRAYLNLRRYRLDKKFSTWLFTIASNLCRNRLRYRRYHPVVAPPLQIEEGTTPRGSWRGRTVARGCGRSSTVFPMVIELRSSCATTTTSRTRRSLRSSPSRRGR